MGLLFSRWHGVERGRRRRSRIQIHHARFGLHASLPMIAGRSCDTQHGRQKCLHAVRTSFHDTHMAPSPCVCELGLTRAACFREFEASYRECNANAVTAPRCNTKQGGDRVRNLSIILGSRWSRSRFWGHNKVWRSGADCAAPCFRRGAPCSRRGFVSWEEDDDGMPFDGRFGRKVGCLCLVVSLARFLERGGGLERGARTSVRRAGGGNRALARLWADFQDVSCVWS